MRLIMKKVFSILTAILILVSGITVSVDKHYCGGELAGTKLSLSGKLATCGMEETDHQCPLHHSVSKKCCDDHLSLYRITGNYLPEYNILSSNITGRDIPSAPQCAYLLSAPEPATLCAFELPPGCKLRQAPSLSQICVYRI